MNTQEPVILGKVKKGSAGKPILVIILFLFIGSIILFLPTIQDYFGDNNIIELIKNGQIVDFFVNHDLYVDKPIINNNNEKEEIKPVLINSKTILNEEKFTLNNFDLTKDKIKFTINTKETINFDDKNYYLVLTQNDKEITTIKLINVVTDTNEQTFKFKETLNDTVGVNGIIKIIRESDYPEFLVSSDESGLASLTCVKDNYKIEYVLNNNNLIRIKEIFEYVDSNRDEYLKIFQEYSNIVTNINNSGTIASIEENYRGFIFKTDIDLSTFDNVVTNNNYYKLNTKTNKINFEMNAKGYDCK